MGSMIQRKPVPAWVPDSSPTMAWSGISLFDLFDQIIFDGHVGFGDQVFLAFAVDLQLGQASLVGQGDLAGFDAYIFQEVIHILVFSP